MIRETKALLKERVQMLEQRLRELEAPSSGNQTETLQQEWMANITHELRTPMHGILSFARFGIKNVEHAPRDKLAQYFAQINTSAERLMLLLNNLLDLSKSATAHQVYVFEPNDILDLINAVAFEYNAAIREKELSLELIAPAGFSTLLDCDAARIRQVLGNLLVNSIKYSQTGGRISFSFSRDISPETSELFLTVSLRDEGIAIPPAEIESVFDKFYQSSRTRTRAGGTGLGLAICREIIRAHRGRIWAENNNPPPGCTLHFSIPCRQPSEPSTGESHDP